MSIAVFGAENLHRLSFQFHSRYRPGLQAIDPLPYLSWAVIPVDWAEFFSQSGNISGFLMVLRPSRRNAQVDVTECSGEEFGAKHLQTIIQFP